MTLILIILLIVTFILNKIISKYYFNKLTYDRKFSKKIVEIDEEFEIETTIENNKIIPISFLKITEIYPKSFEYVTKINIEIISKYLIHSIVMMLLPYQRIKKIYKISCKKRGRYDLKGYNVELTVGDFMGMNTITKHFEKLDDIVVLPKKIDLDKTLIPVGDFYGNISVKRFIIEDPILTIGLREYSGSEPQKNIHWPSSLRYNKLMVKNFDYTTESNIMILLNTEVIRPLPMVFQEEEKGEIEKSISIARSLIDVLEEKRVPYCFFTNGDALNFDYDNIFNFGNGNAYKNRIFELLGRLEYSIKEYFENSIEKIINLGLSNSTFVIVTPILLKVYIEKINYLIRNQNNVILISLDSENYKYLNKKVKIFNINEEMK